MGAPDRLLDLLGAVWLIAGFVIIVARGFGRLRPAMGFAGVWLAGAGALASALTAPGARAAVLAIGLGAALLHLKGPRGGGRLSGAKRAFKPWDQEAALLRLCHGDKALMERLIRHELERNPELSRAGAALAAATRLKHDKR
jgi:hypothetical protein